MAVARPAPPSYLPTLDGWRAVAIVAVLCCHARWRTDELKCLAPIALGQAIAAAIL